MFAVSWIGAIAPIKGSDSVTLSELSAPITQLSTEQARVCCYPYSNLNPLAIQGNINSAQVKWNAAY